MGNKRIHNNKVDYGIRDYRKFYEKKYKKVNKNYKKIISEFNKEIINLIINEGITYKVPHLYLEIMIRKIKSKIRMENGKVINPKPIDWQATNELWEKDEEAKEKKLRIRFNNYNTSGYVFRIFMKKFRCKIKNKSYYKIKPNRMFQRSITKRINDPKKDPFDAFLLYKID